MPLITRRRHGGKAEHPRRQLVGSPSGSRLPWMRFPGRGLRLPKRWRRTILYGAILIFLVGVISLLAFGAWISRDLPDPNRLSTRSIAQSTKVYARDGVTLLYEVHGEERRTLVELDEIGEYTKVATLAIEDKNFYKHQGVSLRGTIRAIWVDITSGRKSQGGSTITQQLVKNAILTREKSIIRKVKEWILAYQIERRFTKDEILKLYFNEIPYGANAYGIEAAAQTYFNKRAQELDLAESALLAALLPAPSYYSPRGNHPDELLARWKIVLTEMRNQGHITKEQFSETEGVDILARVSPYRDKVVAPHFVFHVRDILEAKYGTAELERGGLKVVTTLDPELQRIAEEEVVAGADRNERYGASNAALVAIEPRSGQVLAMVGSRDYFNTERDGNFNVATALRNPGSSFKPIVYLTAFMKGYTPNTMLFDLKTDFGPDGSGKTFSPNNYDFKEHGPVTMRQGLAGSLNIPAVKTLYLAGIPQTVDTANKLGYTTLNDGEFGLALAIGGGAVKLIEHVGAFATLANDGVKEPTTPFLRVEDGQGKVLELFEDRGERVIPEQPVRQLTSVLSDNEARSFVFGSRNSLTLGGRPVAAKTGTTNDFVDGWTVGFTKQLAAGVWIGNNDNSPMNAGADGVVVAAPIWNAFMRRALEGDPIERFSSPQSDKAGKPVLDGQLAEEKAIAVDRVTGRLIPDECVASWPSAFLTTKTIRSVHTILYYISRDDPRGALPSDPAGDPMYARWESAVQAWAKKNNYLSTEPSKEKCSLRVDASLPSVTITSPKPNSKVASSSLAVATEVSKMPDLTSLKYYVDDELLATVKKKPYTAKLDLGQVDNGFRTIRVVATDGTTSAEAQLTINLLKANSSATLYFINPLPRATIQDSDFPVAVKVFAYDPSGVASVTLSLVQPDGRAEVLDTVNAPPDSSVTLSWPTTVPGTYQLTVSMKSGGGKTIQSDALPVTVVAK